MTTLRDALTEALLEVIGDGEVSTVDGSMGVEGAASLILAHPAMQAIADELEQARKDAPKVALAEAVEGLMDAVADESGLAILYVPAGPRPDGRTLADEEGWTVERWHTVWGHSASHGPTLLDALRAAKGERS